MLYTSAHKAVLFRAMYVVLLVANFLTALVTSNGGSSAIWGSTGRQLDHQALESSSNPLGLPAAGAASPSAKPISGNGFPNTDGNEMLLSCRSFEDKWMEESSQQLIRKRGSISTSSSITCYHSPLCSRTSPLFNKEHNTTTRISLLPPAKLLLSRSTPVQSRKGDKHFFTCQEGRRRNEKRFVFPCSTCRNQQQRERPLLAASAVADEMEKCSSSSSSSLVLLNLRASGGRDGRLTLMNDWGKQHQVLEPASSVNASGIMFASPYFSSEPAATCCCCCCWRNNDVKKPVWVGENVTCAAADLEQTLQVCHKKSRCTKKADIRRQGPEATSDLIKQVVDDLSANLAEDSFKQQIRETSAGLNAVVLAMLVLCVPGFGVVLATAAKNAYEFFFFLEFCGSVSFKLHLGPFRVQFGFCYSVYGPGIDTESLDDVV